MEQRAGAQAKLHDGDGRDIPDNFGQKGVDDRVERELLPQELVRLSSVLEGDQAFPQIIDGNRVRVDADAKQPAVRIA